MIGAAGQFDRHSGMRHGQTLRKAVICLVLPDADGALAAPAWGRAIFFCRVDDLDLAVRAATHRLIDARPTRQSRRHLDRAPHLNRGPHPNRRFGGTEQQSDSHAERDGKFMTGVDGQWYGMFGWRGEGIVSPCRRCKRAIRHVQALARSEI
jgi:hypothetical protein